MHFRIERYSLAKDVQKAQKHPKSDRKEYLTPPLLVMNNFVSPNSSDGSQPALPKHLESLTTTVFQSLFPPISPQSTPLSSIRRVLLLNRELPKASSDTSSSDTGSYTINLRHYAITTKRTGLSKGMRKLNAVNRLSKERKKKGSFPNLGRIDDVADYMLNPSIAGGGFTSGSESEIETDAEVEVMETDARKVLSKKQVSEMRSKNQKVGQPRASAVEKKAVKLVEIGPRMRLRMTKVEEGVCGGKVMWHEYLTKSQDEVKAMEKVWDTRRREKEERKRVQKENVERKRKARGENVKGDAEEVDEELLDEDEFDDDDDLVEDEDMESGDREEGVAIG